MPQLAATTRPAPPTRAGHPRATLAVTAAATAVALMNYTAPMLTLPDMAAAFGTPASAQAWLLNGTPLGLAVLLLVAGSLADAHGTAADLPPLGTLRPRPHHRPRRPRRLDAHLHPGPDRPGRGKRRRPRGQPRPPRPRVPGGPGPDQGHRDLARPSAAASPSAPSSRAR
ncbi:hypothetical protein STANM309S_04316 [Streptomyces tanashiensis]